ncbi:hypothetical protein M4951_06170 [Blastopirellula sp. J2-11]|uniref:hypothetical protein n=1 Tax=Blastopirellula sp. J2-11 TaxID=2943192 RepID=UPI0021CA9A0C|nr:hypothetical protein [Blastopirellula sp. J2-11]UUO07897.1 hypothetical protein M4951_06170 [Blastopirellula sp. J2-11]
MASQPPMSHFWTPPDFAGGLGEPWACLATTFEFNAEFFETELLPRFLGLRFDQTENEPSFLVEREEALSLASVTVLVDHSRFDSSQTTLRWDQVQIQIPGGVQHAKITVLAWENLVRIVIGSANLNRVAYRRNREMFAALDFWNGDDSTPIRLLSETLDLLNLMLGWSRSATASVERTQDTLERLRRLVRSWREAPADFAFHERPKATLVVTHPRVGNRQARSTLREMLQIWGNRRATSVTVVSPFVAPAPDPRVGDTVVNMLAQLSLTRECEGWLVAPELPKSPDDQHTRLPFPEVFRDSWKSVFGPRGGGRVLSLPLCVEGTEDRNRASHSKCVVLENGNDDVATMMIGSSNFTPRGMGVGVYNFEANVVFEDAGAIKRNGLRLIERLDLPRDWEEGLDVDDAVWLTPTDLPEDEPDSRPTLPAFFAWATFSQLTGEIKLRLDRSRTEPEGWTINLPGNTEDAPTLFTKQLEPGLSLIDTLSHVLPDTMRAANIVALLIDWHDENGAMQQAKLGVTIECADHLLPPEQFQKLTADAIIECLISGKTPPQWFDQTSRKGKSTGKNNAAIESLHAVDTTSFLLYRVRRFGRALTGMSMRITRTLAHPEAIRYRLVKDPFGPISLARSVVTTNPSEDVDWCAKLDDEHRLFLLTEILLMVLHLQSRVAQKTRGTERKAIKCVFGETIEDLRSLAGNLAESNSIPTNLRDYFDRVDALVQPVLASAKESPDAN